MVDISTIYPDSEGVIAALENMYCYSSFYSSQPAFFFSTQFNALTVGDIMYMLSGSNYVVAQPGFYAAYPFQENGSESYVQVDGQGRYLGTTQENIVCNNPGDFNGDYNSDLNI